MQGSPPCASWAAAAAAAAAAEVCPIVRRCGRRITHALEFPDSSVFVISKQFDSAEVMTRANADKEARSKQLTRKASITARLVSGAGTTVATTTTTSTTEEAEAEAEAAPIEEAAPAPAEEEAPP